MGRYGTPSILRSDNGPHFVAHIIDEFAKVVGTTHYKILPYCSEENATVERINKEINRHITAHAYERATTENYAGMLPFVQRILNSTVNDRMKVSPAQLIYGNSIDLDANILLPRDEIDLDFHSLSKSTDTMLTLQDELIQITACLLKESDDIHNAQQSPNITQFGVDTYVLVQQRTTPETRMHTLWRGPMRVVSHNFAEYILLDLITHKEKVYHTTQQKPFQFDPTHVDPTDIARRDYLEFFIEDILEMKGNIRAYKTLT